MRKLRFLFLALLLPLGACGDDGPTEPEILPECTGNVDVHVSGGTTPEFSWTPRCTLFFVLVEPVGGGAGRWEVESEGGNRIAPGVRYGEVPKGAKQFQAPAALIRGRTYEIILYRYTGPGRQPILAGAKTFTS